MTDIPVPSPATPQKKDMWVPILFMALVIASAIISWRIYRTYRPASTTVTLPKSQSINTPQSETSTSSIPLATPTPDTGPGNYVCDPLGICNLADEKGKSGCPITFADPKCLQSCDTVAKRCP